MRDTILYCSCSCSCRCRASRLDSRYDKYIPLQVQAGQSASSGSDHYRYARRSEIAHALALSSPSFFRHGVHSPSTPETCWIAHAGDGHAFVLQRRRRRGTRRVPFLEGQRNSRHVKATDGGTHAQPRSDGVRLAWQPCLSFSGEAAKKLFTCPSTFPTVALSTPPPSTTLLSSVPFYLHCLSFHCVEVV
jgi:hypothetical protein